MARKCDVTAQSPDTLVVEHPNVALEGMSLYGVIRGDIRVNDGWGERYPVRGEPDRFFGAKCTALWRGSVATYRLSPSGRLELVAYEYPFSDHPSTDVREHLEGDFWLVLKKHYDGPRMYVPFRDGVVGADPSLWIVGGEGLPLAVAAVVDVASAAMPRVMTVGQLIAELQHYPPEMLCVGRTDNPEQAGEIKDILRPNLLPLSKRKKSFTDMMDRTNYEEEVYEYDASSGTKYLMITVR